MRSTVRPVTSGFRYCSTAAATSLDRPPGNVAVAQPYPYSPAWSVVTFTMVESFTPPPPTSMTLRSLIRGAGIPRVACSTAAWAFSSLASVPPAKTCALRVALAKAAPPASIADLRNERRSRGTRSKNAFWARWDLLVIRVILLSDSCYVDFGAISHKSCGHCKLKQAGAISDFMQFLRTQAQDFCGMQGNTN